MDLLELKNINKSFGGKGDKEVTILSDVNLTLKEGEIVSLLGRSGSGKSTLLRIISGLIKPTDGEIIFNGEKVTEPLDDVSMIFQSFALFPWLTIQENIEIALKAKQVPKHEMEQRTAKVIEIIGLAGYESAYPRELSGGMRQRVGFARALAVNPKILLMDEPFSALDILTAKTLRTDFLDLWADKNLSIKSVLLVTHNIEEAVLLSDKIYIFSSNPGSVIAEIKVDLKHPRDRLDPLFNKMVEDIYELMSSKLTKLNVHGDSAESIIKELNLTAKMTDILNFMNLITLTPYNGVADIPELSRSHNLELLKLMPAIESLAILKFLEITKDIAKVTAAGRIFSEGDNKVRKQILGEHLIQYIPLIGHIRRAISSSSTQSVNEQEILNLLLETHPEQSAERILHAAISCARYAGLFVYNDTTREFIMKKRHN